MKAAVLAKEEEAYNLGMVKKPIFQVLSKSPKLPIPQIEYDGLNLVFHKPYQMTVEVEGNYVVHRNARLNLVIAEKSIEKLVDSFFDCFAFLWRDYALALNDELAPCAIRMKEYLLSLAREVG